MGHQKPLKSSFGGFNSIKYFGPSPSGKATDFDSVTRGFESRRPSQKKTIAKAIVFFCYIRLTASYIATQ